MYHESSTRQNGLSTRTPSDGRMSYRYQIEAERLDSKPGDSRPEGLS